MNKSTKSDSNQLSVYSNVFQLNQISILPPTFPQCPPPECFLTICYLLDILKLQMQMTNVCLHSLNTQDEKAATLCCKYIMMCWLAAL